MAQDPTDSPDGPTAEDADSIQQFWDDWRAARRESGVKMESVAMRSGISKTVLYELGRPGKKQFPDDRQVTTLLDLIGLSTTDQATWRERYDRLRAAETAADMDMSATLGRQSGPSWTTLWVATGGAVVVGAALGAAGAIWWSAPASPKDVPYAAIRVQNMVALGDHDLRPDLTPAYLSSQRVSRCAAPAKNCKVAGTDMDTGTLLVATCQAQGEELVNYNLDSTSPDNPHRARSALWYGVRLIDGRVGFINEVYIDPHDRNGLGLSTCP